MKKKNGYIELLRFIFCIVIVIHHSGFLASDEELFFPHGNLIADFFFMLTGYLAYSNVISHKKEANHMSESLSYTLKKLKRVFPYAAVGTIIIYILEFFWTLDEVSFTDRILRLQNLPFELLFMPMTGAIPVNLFSIRNAPLWYLSALLMALPIMMYLASRFEDIFKGWIMWFIPPIVYCYLVTNYGGVAAYAQYSGIVYSGVIRAFADLCIGASTFVVASWLQNKNGQKRKGMKILISFVEIAMLLYVLYSCHRNLAEYDQIVVIYVMALMLSVSFGNVSSLSGINGKIFDFLGRLSMPIYCLHWGVYKYLERFTPDMDYWIGIIIVLVVSIAVSVLMMTIGGRMRKSENS